MKFSPLTTIAAIAILSVLTGVAFHGEMFDKVLPTEPLFRFLLGVGIAALIIGLGGAAGRIPRAIKLLSSTQSDEKDLRTSFQEVLIYSGSFVIGSLLLISLISFL